MCKVLRIVLDVQASWKSRLFRMMMMALDLKLAALYYILCACYLF